MAVCACVFIFICMWKDIQEISNSSEVTLEWIGTGQVGDPIGEKTLCNCVCV